MSKDISLGEQTSCSLSNSVARSLDAGEDDEFVGSKDIVKKVELVQIMLGALHSLGYKTTVDCLENNSGILLRSPSVKSFVDQIIGGEWDASVMTLHHLGLTDRTIKLASFEIKQEKFFELLNREQVKEALKTLRDEITPLCINEERVHELSVCIIFPSQCRQSRSSIQESIVESRKSLMEELKSLLPPTLMIPEKRLVNLLEQILEFQRDACIFHNSTVREISLLIDHQCGRDHIPCQTLQILQEHIHEIWCLKFSHHGKYLASASRDFRAIIWEVLGTGQVSLRHILEGHKRPIIHVSWRHDDLQLLTCGLGGDVRRWDILSGQCLKIYEKAFFRFVSCEWAPDGNSIFTGIYGMLNEPRAEGFIMFDLEGNVMRFDPSERNIKAHELGIPSDRNMLITICEETEIALFDWVSESWRYIKEDQTVISFSLSEDNMFLLVSLLNKELHLWSLNDDPALIAKYKGHKQSRFIVESCFGGVEQAFIASGSEDSQVYIWHRKSGNLVSVLEGHSAAVTCVSWNPANPYMLASGGDDSIIRIWGLNQADMDLDGEA